MLMILEKIITGFFIGIFGMLWFLSSRVIERPNKYHITIYNMIGKEETPNQMRTEFHTIKVAQSFIKEYQQRCPHLIFCLKEEIPTTKSRLRQSIWKIYR